MSTDSKQGGESSRQGRARAYLLAARPQTLTAALSPVIVGWAAASGLVGYEFNLLPALAALLGALLLQIAANFANDLSDYRRGADGPERLGPIRAAASGLLTEKQLFRAVIFIFILAAVPGIYLIISAGWIVLVIGLAGIIAGVTYVGGPWPYGYRGLGEVFVFIFFGVIAVSGTFFVQTGSINSEVFLLSVPVGMTVTAILVVNNVRDLDLDRAVGKRTLAVILGSKVSRYLYLMMLFIAYLIPTLLPAFFADLSWWLLVVWLSFPFILSPVRTVLRDEPGPRFNVALRSTARLHLGLGVLLSFGIYM